MGLKLENQSAIRNSGGNLPGPGNYEPVFKSVIKSLPSYSLKGRYSEHKKLDVPGPGTYNQSFNDKSSAPKYGFGSSPQRESTKKTESQGPGAYKIPVKVGIVENYAMQGQPEQFRFV